MGDFLAFRKMITPVIIQVVFWVGVLVCIIAGIGMIDDRHSSSALGLLVLFIGPLVIRIYCELLILLFRIHDEVRDLKFSLPGSYVTADETASTGRAPGLGLGLR